MVKVGRLDHTKDEEEEEETGFFHKMFNKEKPTGERINRKSEGFLKVKRKSSQELQQAKPQEMKKAQLDTRGRKDKKPQEFKPKQICQYYVNGACNKGKTCTFSHDAPQVKKRDMCKYFLSGSCMKGEDCLYSHDIGAAPCKFFHAMGCCMNGETCKFSHQRLSEEDIYKFIEQNEEFLMHLYRTMGRTNMDDFLQRYLQDKKKTPEQIKSILPPSNVMLPQSLQQAPSGSMTNLPSVQNMQPNMPQNMPQNIPQNMQQNIPQNIQQNMQQMMQQNLPQQFPMQQMFNPRMPTNANVRPQMPLPMLNPAQLNAMMTANPAFFMNFMRNPNAFQGMMQPTPNVPSTQSKTITFNNF